MFDPPPSMMSASDPSHYTSWSTLIYRPSGDVSRGTAQELLDAMKRKYGQSSRVHVAYGRDGGQRRVLTFYCGEIRNGNDVTAYKQFVADLVKRLSVVCTLVYPT